MFQGFFEKNDIVIGNRHPFDQLDMDVNYNNIECTGNLVIGWAEQRYLKPNNLGNVENWLNPHIIESVALVL